MMKAFLKIRKGQSLIEYLVVATVSFPMLLSEDIEGDEERQAAVKEFLSAGLSGSVKILSLDPFPERLN